MAEPGWIWFHCHHFICVAMAPIFYRNSAPIQEPAIFLPSPARILHDLAPEGGWCGDGWVVGDVAGGVVGGVVAIPFQLRLQTEGRIQSPTKTTQIGPIDFRSSESASEAAGKISVFFFPPVFFFFFFFFFFFLRCLLSGYLHRGKRIFISS